MKKNSWVWNEACADCKGYPGYDGCFCTRRYKLRRLKLRLMRRFSPRIRRASARWKNHEH